MLKGGTDARSTRRMDSSITTPTDSAPVVATANANAAASSVEWNALLNGLLEDIDDVLNAKTQTRARGRRRRYQPQQQLHQQHQQQQRSVSQSQSRQETYGNGDGDGDYGGVDLHYVTENVVGMAAPVDDDDDEVHVVEVDDEQSLSESQLQSQSQSQSQPVEAILVDEQSSSSSSSSLDHQKEDSRSRTRTRIRNSMNNVNDDDDDDFSYDDKEDEFSYDFIEDVDVGDIHEMLSMSKEEEEEEEEEPHDRDDQEIEEKEPRDLDDQHDGGSINQNHTHNNVSTSSTPECGGCCPIVMDCGSGSGSDSPKQNNNKKKKDDPKDGGDAKDENYTDEDTGHNNNGDVGGSASGSDNDSGAASASDTSGPLQERDDDIIAPSRPQSPGPRLSPDQSLGLSMSTSSSVSASINSTIPIRSGSGTQPSQARSPRTPVPTQTQTHAYTHRHRDRNIPADIGIDKDTGIGIGTRIGTRINDARRERRTGRPAQQQQQQQHIHKTSAMEHSSRHHRRNHSHNSYNHNHNHNNSPEKISTFLHQNHPNHYLLFNISSAPPSSNTKYLLDNQIVNIPWTCPGISSGTRSRSRIRTRTRSANDTHGGNDGHDDDTATRDGEDHHEDNDDCDDDYDCDYDYNEPQCPTAASIPTLQCLLTICYAMDAYLQLDTANRAIVYCSNGKTRTGIAIAAYLKYSSKVSSTLEGFRLFCAQTCKIHHGNENGNGYGYGNGYGNAGAGSGAVSCSGDVENVTVDDLIPPSLKTLFRNFDALVECGGAMQREQMILRAVTLQGLPVEDMPRVDIWDERGLVYSSHLLMGNDKSGNENGNGHLDDNHDENGNGNKVQQIDHYAHDDDDDIGTKLDHQRNSNDNSNITEREKLMWADEEGFYRVNKKINGDFLLLCRFGGEYAQDTDDPTKVILRYANNTSFLFPAPCELPKTKVDVMRRYCDGVGEEDFLMTFLFDKPRSRDDGHNHDENDDHGHGRELGVKEKWHESPRLMEGREALHFGWDIICRTHCNRLESAHNDYVDILDTDENDMESDLMLLQRYYHGTVDAACLSHVAPSMMLLTLSLQLSNGVLDRAVNEFLEGSMKSIWKDVTTPPLHLFSLPFRDNVNSNMMMGAGMAMGTGVGMGMGMGVGMGMGIGMGMGMGLGTGVAIGRSIPQCLSAVTEVDSRDSMSTENQNDEYSSDHNSNSKLSTRSSSIEEKSRIGSADLANDDHFIPKGNSRFSTQSIDEEKSLSDEELDELEQFEEEDNDDKSDSSVIDLIDSIEFTFDENSESDDFEVMTDTTSVFSFKASQTPELYEIYNLISDPPCFDMNSESSHPIDDAANMQKHGRKERPRDDNVFRMQLNQVCERLSVEQGRREMDGPVRKALLGSIGHKELERLRSYVLGALKSAQGLNSDNGCNRHQTNISEHITQSYATNSEPHQRLVEQGDVMSKNASLDILMQISHLNIRDDDLGILLRESNITSSHSLQNLSENRTLLHADSRVSGADIIRSAIWKKDSISSFSCDDDLGSLRAFVSRRVKHNIEAEISEEDEVGMVIPLVIGGKVGHEGKIIAKDAEFYTVKIPTSALKDRKIVIEKGAMSDTASKAKIFEDGAPSVDAAKGEASQTKRLAEAADVIAKGKEEKAKNNESPALKDDPDYAKYFKMLKMGLSMETVKHALKKDGKDPGVMDGDHNKPVPKLLPLKEDPDYTKYFKMLKMGLQSEAVKHAMKRDGKNPKILDLDHDKPLKMQSLPRHDEDDEEDEEGDDKNPSDDSPPLKDDPDYVKYFKMLKMGLPLDAVKHSLKRDGKDPSIMDLDPNKSLKSQQKSAGNEEDTGPALKDDPDYAKYFKMLKMGLPLDAVKHSLKRDGKDPSIMDLDPDKSLKSQQKPVDDNEEDTGPALKDDPDYAKYFKMLKMGLPLDAVKHSMKRDDKDPSVMDLDPNKSLKSQLKSADDDEEDTGTPLKDDEDYAKYFKMLKMGLPLDAVKHSMKRDDKDPSIMDLDPNKSLQFQLRKKNSGGSIDNGPPLKDDPEYVKYFKMLKMGLPMGAVKNAIQRDGKDPSVMDLDPEKSINSQRKKATTGKSKKPKKPKVRRKKIYWNAIDESKVQQDSIWGKIRGMVKMEKLEYDAREFESLFTETLDPSQKKKEKKTNKDAAKPKKSVQVIDGKRGMNGGIILARLKMDYKEMASIIDHMVYGKFDSTQLKALNEFLPTDEELGGLKMYITNASKNEATKDEAMNVLCACEKYMVAMMEVQNASAKFSCMLFQINFKSRIEETDEAIMMLMRACDDVKNSIRLRKLMAMILTIVNQINTGGTGNLAAGFSLDALLKLNEAKAFDKKTSVLQYLIRVIRKNDLELLEFRQDIVSIEKAKSIMLDGLSGDLKQLKKELDDVKDTATKEGERHRGEDGKLINPDIKMTLAELKEQKTSVRDVNGVKFYNQMEHPVEYIPMEIFVHGAESKVNDATSKLEEVQSSFGSVLHYFGEDEKMASTDFFGTLFAFLESFDAAKLFVEKQEENRKREEKREAAQKAKEAKKLAAKQTKGKPNKLEESKGSNAVKSSNGPKESKASNPMAMGGIAAMAAAAAASKKKQTGDDQSKENGKSQNPNGMKGVAAFAAAAALKRKGRATNDKDVDSHGPDKGIQPAGMGGIAAMAAAAALKKNKSDSRDADPTGTGGIAAMAAAAALKKKKQEKSDSGNDTAPVGMGGIAAMAAAAALKKKKQEKSDSGGADPTGTGGIAAMAAAAALKKKKQEKSDSDGATGMGGIAAMAAAAALKKNKSNSGDADPTGTGGIAAMAAAAALKKKKQEKSDSGNVTAPGGIAAMAAAAALKKKKKQEKSDTIDADSENDAAPGGMGGIAAMAAAAALKKKKQEKSDSEKDTADVGIGGIAAMAAAAALKKKKQEKSDSSDADSANDTKPTGIGGIAAMAATAALKKKKQGNDGKPVGMGGIAAMAAAAALKKNKNQRDANSSPKATLNLEMGTSMDSMDSDMCLEINGSATLDDSVESNRVGLRPQNPILSSSSQTSLPIEERTTIFARPIPKRIVDGAEINTSVNELNNDGAREKQRDQYAVEVPVSSTASKSNIMISSKKKGGRQTYNSTILRPKLQDDHSADEHYDDDELSALPSNFSSRHSVAMFSMDKKNNASDENDDGIDTHSVDSNESDSSGGTKNSTTTVDTLATIQSFTRKTNLAYDELNKRLHTAGKGQNNLQGGLATISDGTLQSLSRSGSTDCPKTDTQMVSGATIEQPQSWLDENTSNHSPHRSEHDSRDDDSTGEEASIINAPAGIAVAAAQAAILRMRNTNENHDSQSYSSEEPPVGNSFVGGGIAAAAAAKAASKRHQQHKKRDNTNVNQTNISAGNIAAAAAQAALKRNQAAQDNDLNHSHGSVLGNAFAGGGGIAAAAAKAALKRSQRLQDVN